MGTAQSGLNLELDVMKKINAQLNRLTNHATRRRVMGNFIERLREEEMYGDSTPVQNSGPVPSDNQISFDDVIPYTLAK